MINLRHLECSEIIATYVMPEYEHKISINNNLNYHEQASATLAGLDIANGGQLFRLAGALKQLIDAVYELNDHKAVTASDFYLSRKQIPLSDCDRTTTVTDIVWFFKTDYKHGGGMTSMTLIVDT